MRCKHTITHPTSLPIISTYPSFHPIHTHPIYTPCKQVRLTFTPAQHWSARGAFDRRKVGSDSTLE